MLSAYVSRFKHAIVVCLGSLGMYQHVDLGCAAVEDTERDLHMGTMTLVACYDDRLLTILKQRSFYLSTSYHLEWVSSGG
jgi:hypothetical protein